MVSGSYPVAETKTRFNSNIEATIRPKQLSQPLYKVQLGHVRISSCPKSRVLEDTIKCDEVKRLIRKRQGQRVTDYWMHVFIAILLCPSCNEERTLRDRLKCHNMLCLA